MPSRFEISIRTILLFLVILAGIWLLTNILDIILLLFIAFILMSALRPAVDRLEKWRINRMLAILLMYVVVFEIIGGAGTIVFPPLINETVKLVSNLPYYLSQIAPFVKLDYSTFIKDIAPIGQNVVKVTFGVFSNILTIFTIAVFSFYFLVERRNLGGFIETFVGGDISSQIINVIRKIEGRLGAWLRGQLLLGLIVGTASFIGLSLLGISYALPLAVIAGILEMVPIIGPIISAIPSVIVALTIKPTLALAVVALYIVIQQLENNILVPMVMRKAVGIPPLASLLALMIGGRLAGTIGIILAVPTLLVIQTIIQEFVSTDDKKSV